VPKSKAEKRWALFQQTKERYVKNIDINIDIAGYLTEISVYIATGKGDIDPALVRTTEQPVAEIS